MRAIILATLYLVLAGAACSTPQPAPRPEGQGFPQGTIVDLTHGFDADTIFWPTADPFQLDVVSDGITDAGYYYAANVFSTAEHGGTHMDAPVHFAEGRQTIDEVPVDRLFGPAVVVDVTAASARDADYLVTVADVESWEAEHGQMPDGAILLIRTGFSSRWPDAARYLGTSERGEAAVAQLHFPGLHPDLARWLVANRTIAAVGIDTASIDYGQSTLFESHQVLGGADVPGLENLAALDRLPAAGAFVIALPMKINGGSGAPLRAVALVP